MEKISPFALFISMGFEVNTGLSHLNYNTFPPTHKALALEYPRAVVIRFLNQSLGRLGDNPSHYSPEGPANTVPSLAAVPKFGVPSEFQFTFCAIVYLVPSHAPAEFASAW